MRRDKEERVRERTLQKEDELEFGKRVVSSPSVTTSSVYTEMMGTPSLERRMGQMTTPGHLGSLSIPGAERRTGSEGSWRPLSVQG
jgi:hypothetical protein